MFFLCQTNAAVFCCGALNSCYVLWQGRGCDSGINWNNFPRKTEQSCEQLILQQAEELAQSSFSNTGS